jgi:hypothetical protein
MICYKLANCKSFTFSNVTIWGGLNMLKYASKYYRMQMKMTPHPIGEKKSDMP